MVGDGMGEMRWRVDGKKDDGWEYGRDCYGGWDF